MRIVKHDSLTHSNSFLSACCHCELNVSSAWWMALSAKIYFDQVSALLCLTPLTQPFPPFFFSQGTPKAQVFLLCSRQAQSLAVICKPRPRAMYFRASPCLCAALIVASVSQTAKQWLIGARQSDLRQREHTQSYSSRSNSSTITGALIWVMLYRLPCMIGQEQQRGWFDTQIHLGSLCYYKL